MIDFEHELITIELIADNLIGGLGYVDKNDIDIIIEKSMVISKKLNEMMIEVNGMKGDYNEDRIS